MNFGGVDITTIPWPMFLLLVFMVVAYLLYLNVYLPLEEKKKNLEDELNRSKEKYDENIIKIQEKYTDMKDIEHDNIEELKEQIQNLTVSVGIIKSVVDESRVSKEKIESTLREVEKYVDNLNHISLMLNTKEASIEEKISEIKRQITDLFKAFDLIRDKIENRRTSRSI